MAHKRALGAGRQKGAEAPAQVLALWNWVPSAPLQAPALRKVRIWIVWPRVSFQITPKVLIWIPHSPKVFNNLSQGSNTSNKLFLQHLKWLIQQLN